MPTTPWSREDEAKPAPGPLRRLQAFVNTLDLESSTDRLAGIDDARPWLVDNGLLSSDVVPGPDDLHLVAGVREGLRAVIRHDSGGPAPDGAAMAPLREVAEAGAVRVSMDGRGRVSLGVPDDSVRGRLLALLLVAGNAQRDGTWMHLKTCANEDCLWVFYDRSRNHGGTWCDMASCGNKLKNRDFRARRRRPR